MELYDLEWADPAWDGWDKLKNRLPIGIEQRVLQQLYILRQLPDLGQWYPPVVAPVPLPGRWQYAFSFPGAWAGERHRFVVAYKRDDERRLIILQAIGYYKELIPDDDIGDF
ncbi:MAG TPA: hypothetical protein VGO93_20685 [Candidatus Xenobia bacterium]